MSINVLAGEHGSRGAAHRVRTEMPFVRMAAIDRPGPVWALFPMLL